MDFDYSANCYKWSFERNSMNNCTSQKKDLPLQKIMAL